ncbi:hypothetical protein P3T76_004975 [Phytophthora citrophthora]|uniref:Uncharacterized protein n=1 Tax=Phytophthora citrophthora TaxID=4793 RepID=A0AAD9GS54_9STRA|nr:hypothetical protein P3T76_004975 [Phytophthora citrophthora]
MEAAAHAHDTESLQVAENELPSVAFNGGAWKLRDIVVLDDFLVGETLAQPTETGSAHNANERAD